MHARRANREAQANRLNAKAKLKLPRVILGGHPGWLSFFILPNWTCPSHEHIHLEGILDVGLSQGLAFRWLSNAPVGELGREGMVTTKNCQRRGPNQRSQKRTPRRSRQDMASLDGLQGGLKELLGQGLGGSPGGPQGPAASFSQRRHRAPLMIFDAPKRCRKKSTNYTSSFCPAEACPDASNNTSEQFNLERHRFSIRYLGVANAPASGQ